MAQELIEKPLESTMSQLKQDATDAQSSTVLSSWKMWGIGAALLLVGFGVGINFRPQEPSEVPSQNSLRVTPLTVETLSVEPVNSYGVQRTYTGEVAALRSSDIGFERGGKVVLLSVEEGERVKVGTPLATLDTANLETTRQGLLAQKAQAVAVLQELKTGARREDISAARAGVTNIEQQLELEKIKRSRREYLYNQGAISKEQLDEVAFGAGVLQARREEAQSRLDELLAGTRPEKIQAQEAVVRQLEAQITDIEINLRKSTVKAPFSGTISQRLVDEGTVIATGQPVIRLVENGKPEVRIGVPVSMAGKLSPDTRQQVRIGEATYQGTVSSILPEVDPSTRTQTVVLKLDSSAAFAVAPGAIARLELEQTIATQGYWLPTTALVKGERGLWSCYVVRDIKNDEKEVRGVSNQEFQELSSNTASETSYKVESRDIEVLHTEGNRVLVRGTLQPGERVIARGTQRVVSGQLVQEVSTFESY